MAPIAQGVTVSLEDLKNGTVPFETLREAFGPDSLGILVVKDLPPEFAELRRRVLSYSSYLGNLPKPELDKLENSKAKHLIGWSLGKETLRDGRVDTRKGSFYANCAFYVDPSLAGARPPASSSLLSPYSTRKKEEGREGDDGTDAFPEYLTANMWPADGVLPGFRPALERLCRLVIDAAVLVARACDRFAEADMPASYPPGYLERVVSTSTTTKARLLHYFPEEAAVGKSGGGDGGGGGDEDEDKDGDEEKEGTDSGEDEDEDDWCATHLDHGCLTGLTSAMFVDEAAVDVHVRHHDPQLGPSLSSSSSLSSEKEKEGNFPNRQQPPPQLPELDAPPDPRAGLYIKSRAGRTVQVRIPRDCVAFQTGEALERITGGRFRAVPHFVRGPRRRRRKGRGWEEETGGGSRQQQQQQRIARNTLAVFTQPDLGEEVDLERHVTFADFAREIVSRNTVS